MFAATNSNFLVPNWTFVAELLIFLVVLGVMARFVLPQLSRAVTDRTDGIRRAVQQAEARRAEAAAATAERRRVLTQAREDARAMVDAAIIAAEEDRRNAILRGQAEGARLMEDARGVIATERLRARHDLRDKVGTLIVAAAERVIGSHVDAGRHAAVIAEAVAAVESGS
jgi:F-type H+-transporting ATPase subunit b